MKTHDYEKYSRAYAAMSVKDSLYIVYDNISRLVKKDGVVLDYGCGGGRSTRFFKSLGIDVIGVDNNSEILKEAKSRDSNGDYYLIKSGDLSRFEDGHFDSIISTAVFLEISSKNEMKKILQEMKRVLKKNGRIFIGTVCLNESGPNEWTFTNYDFPENKNLKSGQTAKLIFKESGITFYDYAWSDEDYIDIFANSGLNLIKKLKPLATGKEPFKLSFEQKRHFWTIYVLGK